MDQLGDDACRLIFQFGTITSILNWGQCSHRLHKIISHRVTFQTVPQFQTPILDNYESWNYEPWSQDFCIILPMT